MRPQAPRHHQTKARAPSSVGARLPHTPAAMSILFHQEHSSLPHHIRGAFRPIFQQSAWSGYQGHVKKYKKRILTIRSLIYYIRYYKVVPSGSGVRIPPLLQCFCCCASFEAVSVCSGGDGGVRIPRTESWPMVPSPCGPATFPDI